jgi:hypothetical protein
VPDPGDLYGLPLDRFIAERGALAKTLRGQGEKASAARVAGLRKPSVAAWTVNQLVRTQRAAVSAVFNAGDELQRVQSELLAGRGDAEALREATRRERQAVDELTAVARGLLSSDGQEPTQATLDRVSETLHAAALDEDARSRVREGCLERELRQVGFGAGGFDGAPGFTSAPVAPARASGGGDGKRVSARGAKRDPDEAERVAREEAERARATQLKSARKAEATAHRQAERAARQLSAAQERRDRAAAALRDAEEALAGAEDHAGQATLEHRRAQELLERVSDEQ